MSGKRWQSCLRPSWRNFAADNQSLWPRLENAHTQMGEGTQGDGRAGPLVPSSSGMHKGALFAITVENLAIIVASAARAAIHKGVFKTTGHCGSSGRNPLD